MHTQVVLLGGFDPLDAIAPYEVLYADGSATDGAVTVELVTAEGPREVVSGIGGLTLRAVGALGLEREVGPRVAHAVGELVSHERRGTVWRSQGPTPVTL
jgi:hypothetical protein